MILGLPFSTFFFTFIFPGIGILGAILYGLTFKDDNKWWTIEDLTKSSENEKKGG